MAEEKILMSVDDLCERMGISRNTAYNLLTSGQIKSFKMGKTWKIPSAALDEYIKEQCEKPYTPPPFRIRGVGNGGRPRKNKDQ